MSKPEQKRRILIVASEAVPWVKTGGLADACGSLSRALAGQGHEVRLLLPAYGDLLAEHPGLQPLAAGKLLRAPTDSTGLVTWFAPLPGISDRQGNPYHDAQVIDWPDNHLRFAAFSQLASQLADDSAGLNWRPDIVHCHDWQTGLVPLYMMLSRNPAASVFTIHNLAYRGLFSHSAFQEIGLPQWLWHADALEFHQQLALIKAGLVFADCLNTVSPSYAEEILLPEHGQGLDGLLRHRRTDLHGILNGIDVQGWDPATDPALPAHFSATDLSGKQQCKTVVQQTLGLRADGTAPLLGVVSRLVEQKGIDLILELIPALLERGCQLAILGSGDADLEQRLSQEAGKHPDRIGLRLGFDEQLAHRIEAGADMFLMPSRFEPCGLNQMYSQRYGTPPIVRATGGLADSVVDASPQTRKRGKASGFCFDQPDAESLLATIDRALSLWCKPRSWRRIQLAGMQRDFSWQRSAEYYLRLYQQAESRLRFQTIS